MSQLSLAAIDAASPPADPALSQWYTPPWLAKRMVEWAGVEPSMRVLEPSCGNGRIVSALLDAGARVCGYEIDERMLPQLRPEIARGACIHRGNFLTARDWAEPCRHRSYDVAVQNPPYEDALDVSFIMGALAWAQRTVALVRTTTFHGVDRHRDLWKHVHLRRVAFLIRRPDFGGEHGAKADFMVVEVHTRKLGMHVRDAPAVEWW